MTESPLSGRVTSGPIRSTMFWLALPVLGEQMLNSFIGMFDTWLAGQISAPATSAIGLAAYVAWLGEMLIMLVATGATAVVSRLEGQKDHTGANHIASQAISLAVIAGVLIALLIYLAAAFFARTQAMTGETYAITVHYLKVEAISLLPFSVTLVGCAALRGTGNMRTPLLIFTIVNIVNVIVSPVLVTGAGPFPQLGVNGIVAGTLTARILGGVLTWVILARGRAGLTLQLADLPIERASAMRLLKIGMPAAVDGAVMWAGHFIFLSIVARLASGPLGDAYYAANIVAVRVESLTYLPAFAWGAAAATMIGQSLGAGDRQRARRVGHQGVLQCGFLSVCVSAFFFLCARHIYQFMNADPLVAVVGTAPFRVVGALQPLMTVAIIYIHAMRGAGDTRMPMCITILGMVFRLPVAYYFGYVLNGGLMGVWIGMFGDMFIRAALASIRYARGRWLHTEV